jgi:(2R)-ethylmalonyl-CoA mutase
MANAIAVLDAVRERVDEAPGGVFGRISFFVNAGCASSRARQATGDGGGRSSGASATASGSQAPALPLRRAVNSLGLTESQPENNAQRIARGAGGNPRRDARARAIQLPA